MKDPLRGVIEVRADDISGTYRAMYTVRLQHVVYVLHDFQKKSKRGIATPKPDLDLIQQRYKTARQHYANYETQDNDSQDKDPESR